MLFISSFCCQSVRLLLHCDDDDDQTKPVATSDNIRTRERDTWNTRLSRRLNNNSLGVLFRRMATATRSAGNKCLATMLLAKYCYRTHPFWCGNNNSNALHYAYVEQHVATLCACFAAVLLLFVSLTRWGVLSHWTLELPGESRCCFNSRVPLSHCTKDNK